MKKLTFNCGCSFDILDETPEALRINLDIDFDNLPFQCGKTWDLISSGDCKGVFQLDSQLGRSTAKKLKPRTVEHLGAASAILRPGCSEAFIEGKSVTQHYIDRKNGIEEVSYYHPALIPALKSTYGLLVYQEQAMQIVKDIAGFNLQEADGVRKAIGKKLTEEMAKIKKLFTDKAKEVGIVTEQEAEEIFSWIEKSQRYSFNKSHAISYAFNGFLAAYCKAHFTRAFFTSYLYHSKDKSAKQRVEIKELVNNARMSDIEVRTPNFLQILTKSTVPDLKPALHFMLRNKIIYVGFSDIKDVGEGTIEKIAQLIPTIEAELGRTHDKWSWLDILLYFMPHVKKTVAKAMMCVGCFSHLDISRTKMIYEYDALAKLTDKEVEALKKRYCPTKIAGGPNEPKELIHLLWDLADLPVGRAGGGVSSKNRLAVVKDVIKTIQHPPYSLDDSPAWIAGTEDSLLGISLTCTRVDGRDTSLANTTCKEFADGKSGYCIIAGQITSVNEVKTKTGKSVGSKMAFLTIEDTSGSLDNVVAFPDSWKENSGLLVSGNLVLIGGERKGKESGFILKKAWQI